MAQAKKFGTFSGVFTPSILTILGVIMYLRFPWIVGNAGLWTTISIVIVAHIISVTTGLSVSSIATDKKVKAGGTYYMISRSLGLSIGGTLGLALAVGLAFSVSLYLIGFSESFLSFWGWEVTKNNIRIAGTVALILVTTVTFISTALALKSQFFILGAIILSLISIFFGNHDFAPTSIQFAPLADAAPWMLMFGIFFPAVTGFEAGVSMSGDLQDPKKSIPIGSIAAIAVGLIVYIGLAVFFATTIDRNELINNPNILLDSSLYSPFVIAGIWCATISSALGSILASPRILQAAAVDKIAPRIFAKGHGKENEPRNALLLTFVIAEVGILIGELDIIARIVSMFFITTYGFLNMSSALESWASTDFRPEFKIPVWVSIIGALACFIVMILLDFLAMVGATVVLGGLFLLLKRRELTLESGDTWEGVWSSIVRTGLQKLDGSKQHQRNWRPNVILFSGGNEARPHLIKFGEWIVRKRGILSNFELIEDEHLLLPIKKLAETEHLTETEIAGVFSRKVACKNIYEGMETVSQLYGFSGIDPNSVMLGWARNTTHPEKFAELIHHFANLDYNILILDYDQSVGFRHKKRIDIWWRGGSNNATLALNMLKFLKTSEDWEDTEARIIIVVYDSSMINRVYKNMNRILDDERIEADVKVINNGIEKRPIREIIEVESLEADLTMIGLPLFSKDQSENYVSETDKLIKNLGTVLLVHAASNFETLYVGIEKESVKASVVSEMSLNEEIMTFNFNENTYLTTESGQALTKIVAEAHLQIDEAMKYFANQTLLQLSQKSINLAEEISHLFSKQLKYLEKHTDENSIRQQRHINRLLSEFLYQTHEKIAAYQNELSQNELQNYANGLEQIEKMLATIVVELPDWVELNYTNESLKVSAHDRFLTRLTKLNNKIKHGVFKKPLEESVYTRGFFKYQVNTVLPKILQKQLNEFGIESYEFCSQLQKWINQLIDCFAQLDFLAHNEEIDVALLENELVKFENRVQEITSNFKVQLARIVEESRSDFYKSFEENSKLLTKIDANRRIKNLAISPVLFADLKEIPEAQIENTQHFYNFVLMDVELLQFKNRIRIILKKFNDQLKSDVENNYFANTNLLKNALEKGLQTSENIELKEFANAFSNEVKNQFNLTELHQDFTEALTILPEKITVVSEESIQNLQNTTETLSTVDIKIRQLINYELEDVFFKSLDKITANTKSSLLNVIETRKEVVRLIGFQQSQNAEIEETETVKADQLNYTKIAVSRIKESLKKGKETVEKFGDRFAKLQDTFFNNLNPYIVVRQSANLGYYIRSSESQKVISSVESKTIRAKNKLKKILTQLIYRNSAADVFNPNDSVENVPILLTEQFYTAIEKVSPIPRVDATVPAFYKSLFIGKQQLTDELWVNRYSEIKQFEEILRRYKNGISGAILVIGDANSGKTALCRTMVNKHFSNAKIHQLFPPRGGSIEVNVFYKQLRQAFESNSDKRQIFDELSNDNVLIINNLEMWWERSSNGFNVVEELLELIKIYGSKCLFVINMNIHFFKLIEPISRIDESSIGLINCPPIGAEALQNAILLRHKSTGLEYVLDGKSEGRHNSIQIARFFNTIQAASDGNIGIAMHKWIASIAKYSENQVYLRKLPTPQFPPLSELEEWWRIWLFQFVLHRELTGEKLSRIFKVETDLVEENLKTLFRAGLIIEKQSGIWEINILTQKWITSELKKSELL